MDGDGDDDDDDDDGWKRCVVELRVTLSFF